MKPAISELLTRLLSDIHFLMEDSLKAYTDYQQNGKTYRYAKELRRCNSSMIDLLTANENILTDELKTAATALTEHYTIWRNKWDELEREISPEPDDVFVFENKHVFPKQAAVLLEKEYQNLLNQ